MRKFAAGFLALTLASGAALAINNPAAAVPPVDGPIQVSAPETPTVVDDLPNPAEEKRRALGRRPSPASSTAS